VAHTWFSSKVAVNRLNFPMGGMSLNGNAFESLDRKAIPVYQGLNATFAGGLEPSEKEEGAAMKKFGFAGIIAGGLIATVVGLAAPAQADISHNIWANQQNQPSASVPHVDTSVHQSP
jgi:hypothetical protein